MMVKIDFRIKRAKAAKWVSKNLVLKDGVIGYEKDTRLLKVGDGVTPWNALPYAITKGDKGDKGDKGTDGATYEWLSGTAAPVVASGKVGDWYINTNTGDIYKKTAVTTWTLQCNIKGAQGIQGLTGAAGASAYVHIRWGTSATPSTLLTTPADYIGLASTNSASAPATYTGYTWYKIKGEAGSAATDITGNAKTATSLQTARTIDGVSFNGSASISHYGECLTAAGTAAKTAAIDGFTLVKGARAAIRFSATNTAASITLNINGTGAKDMYFRGSKITNAAPTLQANMIYDFIYTGTYYELVGNIALGYGF